MDKTFLIRWFGPFFDREDERNWEREQKEKFNLYMICGIKEMLAIHNYNIVKSLTFVK